MKLVIREKAADDLDEIFAWIARDNPQAAQRTVKRLRDRIERLGQPGLSHIGRPGSVASTRELVEPPYIVVYAVDAAIGEITILAVLHGARNRP